MKEITNNDTNLCMTLVGFKPKGFNTEQHDVMFPIGPSVHDSIVQKWIRNTLPVSADTKIHIDAWVNVQQADGYQVRIVPVSSDLISDEGKELYFLNLGGYTRRVFKEHHMPLLWVGNSPSEVIKRAKKHPFMKQMDKLHKKALPHLDDNMKLGGDVDDIFRVQDILGENHRLVLTRRPGYPGSIFRPKITGYYKIEV